MMYPFTSRIWTIGFAIVAVMGSGRVSAQPTVILVSQLNPSSYGQTVTFVATVTDPAVPKAQLNGTMTFTDAATVLGTSTARSGVASLKIRNLTGGDHSITATYTPPNGGSPVTSSPIVQQVKVGSSTTTISTTNANVYNGRAGSIKARVKAVSPAIGVPTGYVDFYLSPYDPNISPDLVAPLDSTGTAIFDFAYLYGPNTYSVTAFYSGDGNFASSISAVLTQTVLPNSPTASSSFFPETIAVGASSQLTVSAYNPTPWAMNNVALGVMPGAPIAVISTPANAICGARTGLYYCLISVPAGATKSLVFKMTPTAAGTYTANSYARNNDTGDETYATVVLTAQ